MNIFEKIKFLVNTIDPEPDIIHRLYCQVIEKEFPQYKLSPESEQLIALKVAEEYLKKLTPLS